MSNSNNKKNGVISSNNPHIKKKWLILGAVIFALVVATSGYLLISKITNTGIYGSDKEKVLTIKDLENPKVEITPNTSDASVENIKNEEKAKIDKQVAGKENPIDTVKETAGFLSNTTNQKRKDQLANFLEEFLANHKNELWFKYKNVMPDQAQVNYWKSELYAKLVYNYQFMMLNKFTGSDGKLINTTKEQLKYIDLYLALANDPKSHIVISEENKEFITDYQYSAAKDFLKIKNDINSGQYNG